MLSLLLPMLAEKGLGLLQKVIMKKGKAFIEEKTGVKLDEPQNLSSEDFQKLKEYELNNETELQKIALEKIKIDAEVEKNAQINLTERHKADMSSSDLWSKRIRPSVLGLLTIAFCVATFTGDLVELNRYTTLQELLTYVFGYYFIGRTVEKGPLSGIMKGNK